MEDIRIGRATIHTPRIFNLANTSRVIFDYSSDRTQMMIYPPPSGVITISPYPTTSITEGIFLNQDSHPLLMTVESHGDLVKRMWSSIHSVGGVSVFVSEGRLDKI